VLYIGNQIAGLMLKLLNVQQDELYKQSLLSELHLQLSCVYGPASMFLSWSHLVVLGAWQGCMQNICRLQHIILGLT